MKAFYSMVFRHEGHLFLGELNEYGHIEGFSDLEQVPAEHLPLYPRADCFYYVYVREDDNDNIQFDRISTYQIGTDDIASIMVGNIEFEALARIANEILISLCYRKIH